MNDLDLLEKEINTLKGRYIVTAYGFPFVVLGFNRYGNERFPVLCSTFELRGRRKISVSEGYTLESVRAMIQNNVIKKA